MRILIADDNADAALGLATLLDLRGHETVTALDGGEAVRLALEWKPDVAILDIRMPVLDGHGVARVLRSKLRDTILVAFSAHLLSGGLEVARSGLFDLWFPKGVSFEQIHASLHEWIAKRAAPPSPRRADDLTGG